MKVSLEGSTNTMIELADMLKFSQDCARQCYSAKQFCDIKNEDSKPKLLETLLNKGHHSVFGHVHLTFSLAGIPKTLAMILNNEKAFETSEKSARYTKMSDVKDEQQELYDKWIGKLEPHINTAYPNIKFKDEREKTVERLAMENARYMISVFTPTNMMHTVSLQQLNFLLHDFDNFIEKNINGNDIFKKRVAEGMMDFNKQMKNYRVKELKNMTGRQLSFFGNPMEEFFGDVYATNYDISFAGFAQAQRHRTINYKVTEGYELTAPNGFFVPKIVSDANMQKEWLNDLGKVAETDFPQAQIISITESSTLDNFVSKMHSRVCGHAQYEIMNNMLEVTKEYAIHRPQINDFFDPGCSIRRAGSCDCYWGNRALEREV